MLKVFYFIGEPWEIENLNKKLEEIQQKYYIDDIYVNFIPWRGSDETALYILIFAKEKEVQGGS